MTLRPVWKPLTMCTRAEAVGESVCRMVAIRISWEKVSLCSVMRSRKGGE